MIRFLSLAVIGVLLVAATPAAVAKNPNAPGQLKKRYGSVPGYPGASGYAPGHLKRSYTVRSYSNPTVYGAYRW
jgi:hypothetical protein